MRGSSVHIFSFLLSVCLFVTILLPLYLGMEEKEEKNEGRGTYSLSDCLGLDPAALTPELV